MFRATQRFVVGTHCLEPIVKSVCVELTVAAVTLHLLEKVCMVGAAVRFRGAPTGFIVNHNFVHDVEAVRLLGDGSHRLAII